MEKLESSGESPGWVSRHRAVIGGPDQIRIFGGKIGEDGTDLYSDNTRAFILDSKNSV